MFTTAPNHLYKLKFKRRLQAVEERKTARIGKEEREEGASHRRGKFSVKGALKGEITRKQGWEKSSNRTHREKRITGQKRHFPNTRGRQRYERV